MFQVTDLKQYTYCARILYYHTILPQIRPITYKMTAGMAAHQQAQVKEKRRQLRTYGLKTGQRTFNVPLFSPELSLSGELDMLIQTDNTYIPVDYKMTTKAGTHFRLQLMAYGRLLQQIHPHKQTKHGFLYLIPTRQAVKVNFTPSLQRRLEQALNQMQAIYQQQQMPPATSQRQRCPNCEFRRFCNDVL